MCGRRVPRPLLHTTRTHSMPPPARRRRSLRGGAGPATDTPPTAPASAARDLFDVLAADLAAAAAACPVSPAGLLDIATFKAAGSAADASYLDPETGEITGVPPLAWASSATAASASPASTLAWLADGARAEAVAVGVGPAGAGTVWEGALPSGRALPPGVARAIARAAGRADPGDARLAFVPIPAAPEGQAFDADGDLVPAYGAEKEGASRGPSRAGAGGEGGGGDGGGPPGSEGTSSEEDDDDDGAAFDLGDAAEEDILRRPRVAPPLITLEGAAAAGERAAAVLSAAAGGRARLLPRDAARLPALRWATAAAGVEAAAAAEAGQTKDWMVEEEEEGDEEEEEEEDEESEDSDGGGDGEGGGGGGGRERGDTLATADRSPSSSGPGSSGDDDSGASDSSSGDEWAAAARATWEAPGTPGGLAALASAGAAASSRRELDRRRAARARARARRRASLTKESYVARASGAAADVVEAALVGGDAGGLARAAERGSSGDEADALEDEVRWAPPPPTDVREPAGSAAARAVAGGQDPRPDAPKPAYGPAAVAAGVGGGGGGGGDLGLALMARGVFSMASARASLSATTTTPPTPSPSAALLFRLRGGWAGGGGAVDVGFGVYARPGAAVAILGPGWGTPTVPLCRDGRGLRMEAAGEGEDGEEEVTTSLTPPEAAAADPTLYRDVAASAGALGLTVMAWVPHPVPVADLAAALGASAKANAAAAAGDAFRQDVAARGAVLAAGGLPPLPALADVRALAWPPLKSLRADIQAADALAAELARVAGAVAAEEGSASGWVDGAGRLLPGAKILFTATPGGHLLVEALPAPPPPPPRRPVWASALAYLLTGPPGGGEARGAPPNPRHDGDGPGDPLAAAPGGGRGGPARLVAYAPAPAARLAALALLGPLAPDPVARARLGSRLLWHARGGEVPGEEGVGWLEGARGGEGGGGEEEEEGGRLPALAPPPPPPPPLPSAEGARTWLTLPGAVSGADALAAMPPQWADALDPAAAAWELPVVGWGGQQLGGEDEGPPMLVGHRAMWRA